MSIESCLSRLLNRFMFDFMTSPSSASVSSVVVVAIEKDTSQRLRMRNFDVLMNAVRKSVEDTRARVKG